MERNLIISPIKNTLKVNYPLREGIETFDVHPYGAYKIQADNGNCGSTIPGKGPAIIVKIID